MYFLVKIEFQRIQTFLFAARRLRDMVGANVLLGETIRCDLVGLVKNTKINPEPVDLTQFASSVELPGIVAIDPLSDELTNEDKDNPSELYKCGILSRDGGHFWAVFNSGPAAEDFRLHAENLIADKLEGLNSSVSIESLEETFKRNAEENSKAKQDRSSEENAAEEQTRSIAQIEETDLVHVPQLQLCTESELGYASPPDPSSKKTHGKNISKGLFDRREAYEKFKAGNSRDIIGLLNLTGTAEDDFNTMCGQDYMAVIVADGNDIGINAQRHRSRLGSDYPIDMKSFVEREIAMEAFFQKTRTALRKATQEAIQTVFSDDGVGQAGGYKLMMLGGDDLLFVCPAKAAAAFAIELARETKKLFEISGGLTLGIGITIAAPNVPFHHLHENAEALASSAKRLYRRTRADNAPCSTVDWLVETGSWTSDPMGQRQKEYLARSGDELLSTSCRPLRVLGQQQDPEEITGLRDLERLYTAARDLKIEVDQSADEKSISRGRLHEFAHTLSRGRHWSMRTLAQSPAGFQQSLKKTSKITPDTLWQDQGHGLFTTEFQDLIEILEISYLGTQPVSSGAGS